MREEMATGNEEDGGPSVPMSMERDVIMSESSDLAEDHQDDYGPIVGHPLGNHRSLFSVTPCSIEYQYWSGSYCVPLVLFWLLPFSPFFILSNHSSLVSS